jgi:hypothetical protein
MLPMRKYQQRIHYTETDKALMWDRWRKGGLPLSSKMNVTQSEVLSDFHW